MDLLDLLKLMFRRWYVSAPVVVVTLGAALAFGLAIQPEYKTEAAILLVPPTTTAAPDSEAAPRPGNPWLRIGENAMAQAVQISTSAHDARTRVAAAGGDPDYEVGLVTRSSILTVTVVASTEASARTTVVEVTRLINDEVAGQQAQYRPNPGEQITTEVLDPGLNIVQSRSNVLRAQIVILAIGVLLAAAAAVGYDAWSRRRATAQLGGRRGARNSIAWNHGQAVVGTSRSAATAPRVGPGPGAGATPGMRAPGAVGGGRDTPQPTGVAGRPSPGQAVEGRGGQRDRTGERGPGQSAEDRPAGPAGRERGAPHAGPDRLPGQAGTDRVPHPGAERALAHPGGERGPGRPVDDRAGERTNGGSQRRADHRHAVQSDETILLTVVRDPADEPNP
ncbi:hypothetical protein [Plantactinospora sp. CA-290183]|uniref:hypothetical protein n=1 Tax=Plantactinospora sp. CA-290183 TaxID=3240006 RepID=UPI003D8C922A